MPVGRDELDLSADVIADEFGSDATYEPLAGGSIPLRAVMTYAARRLSGWQFSSDEPMSTEISDMAEIRMMDVFMPVEGDILRVGSEHWSVDTFIRSGSMWILTLIGPPQLVAGDLLLESGDPDAFLLEDDIDGSSTIITEDV